MGTWSTHKFRNKQVAHGFLRGVKATGYGYGQKVRKKSGKYIVRVKV